MTATVPTVTAWDFETVDAVHAPGCDILVVERRLPDYSATVAAARVADARRQVAPGATGLPVAEAMTELGLRDAHLLADVAGVCDSFLAQFALAAAELRVELVDRATCPKFHCDNARVRLVATYHGPATEYRTAGDDAPRQAPPGALVFLKGHKHPTHADTVLHRSPRLESGGRRLCVVLTEADAPAPDPETP
jgi:hypothetical protein